MRKSIIVSGVATLSLLAAPAFAGGVLGSSGNGGGLLGGGPQMGGNHGGYDKGGYGQKWQSSSQSGSSKEYSNRSLKLNDTTLGGVYLNPQIQASKAFSNSEASGGGGKHDGGHKDGSYGGGKDHNGGKAAAWGQSGAGGPGGSQAGSGAIASNGGHARNSSGAAAFGASFPIAVTPTTLGGFEASKTNYSSNHENKSQASWSKFGGR